jgi:hypothetical protein
MKLSKLSSAIVLSTLLSACGGGAGTESKLPLSLTASETKISLPESEETNIPLTLTNTQGEVKFEHQEMTGAQNAPIVKINTTTITFISNELYQEAEYRFKITATDANNSKVDLYIDVSGINTSAISKVELLKSFKNSHDKLLSGSDEVAVASAMYGVTHALGLISNKTLEKNINTVNSLFDSENQESLLLSNTINQTTPLDEYEIDRAIADIKESLSKRVRAANQIIQTIQEQNNTLFPVMDLGEFTLNDGHVGQFTGNSKMGSGDDWVFSDEYAFLNAILFPESQPCTLSK